MISSSHYNIFNVDVMDITIVNFYDLMIADPPFGINFDNRLNTRSMGYDGEIYDDSMSPSEYYKFSKRWISVCYDALKENGSLYIISGWNKLYEILKAVKETRFDLTNHCIWPFSFGMFCSKKYVTSHYHILFLTKGNYKFYGHYEEDVIRVGSNYRSDNKYLVKGHPCQLPVSLMKYLILRSSDFDDNVGDIFSGSGTTALACRMLGRNVDCFEKNESFIPIIKKKIKHNLPIQLDYNVLSTLM